MQIIYSTFSDDAALVENAQNDIKQFGHLYSKYHKQIYLFIHKRIRDDSLTKDITSETFLKAMNQINRYVDRGVPFSAWLYRIASNEVTGYFRKGKNTRFVVLEEEAVADLQDSLELENDSMMIPELQKALSKLAATELELVEFVYTECKTYKEIAEITETTEDNIKIKMFRIRQKLKKIIDSLK